MSIVKQNSELYRRKLIDLLNNFEMYLNDGSLREQVLYLVPVNEILRNLGASLVEGRNITSARDRILSYLRACLETHLSIMKRFNSMLAMAI